MLSASVGCRSPPGSLSGAVQTSSSKRCSPSGTVAPTTYAEMPASAAAGADAARKPSNVTISRAFESVRW